MIAWELDPFYTRGGTAYAIRRLADQLTELGIETRVLLPDWLETRPGKNLKPLLMPITLNTRAEFHSAPRTAQYSEFCPAALTALEQIKSSFGSDAVIAHSDVGAMFIVLQSEKRSSEPSVFWLHSLYDPPINDLSKNHGRLLPSPSLLASAVMMADIVVTSTGILKDAQEFEWPDRLKELQKALTTALAERRVLTVESVGCLPEVPEDSENELNLDPGSNLENLKNVPSPYILFPARPSMDKGFGIFAAIAKRLRRDNVSCVAVQRPRQQAKAEDLPHNAPLYWLPWLEQHELRFAMRNAACTVLPSVTEGFGLAAAESISEGVPTLYQQVGGHHSLEEFPNALRVPLTTSERMLLYGLWSELIGADDCWRVWIRYEHWLRPLIDRWVEAIGSVVHRRAERIEATHFPEQPVEERWGNKLRHRIQVG